MAKKIIKLTSIILFNCLMMQTIFAEHQQPKLILQITIDAMRGDFLQRFDYLFDEDGGFEYLKKNGLWYSNALYQHANTETIVGHVSLATGSMPSTHGMIANAWFDRHEDRMIYNIEDANYKLLTAGGGVDKKSEIDHTQKTAKNDGRSPLRILASTLSDEIALASNGKAKIFAVSIKDRGAVSMAGQTGKAFWFSKSSSQFVTSNYYYEQYPSWVEDFNAARHPQKYANSQWQLTRKPDSYRFINDDDQEFETALPGFGRTFPHNFGPADNKYFTTFLTLSPVGDELTLDFARQLILNEDIGKDKVTDYLAISFSSNDYVGHVFGASSLENEDNLVRLDKTLAQLLAFIDQEIGLANTLILFSSDHGQPEAAGFLNKHGIHNISYFDIEAVKNSDAVQQLMKKYGSKENLIEGYFHPYIYLNEKAITKDGRTIEEVEKDIAQALQKVSGIKTAIPGHRLIRGEMIDNQINKTVVNNFHPTRSGNLYIVFESNVFINDFEGLTVASTHGAPWHYDRHVPVIITGKDIKARKVNRQVTPYALAPTISHYLGIRAPSGSVDEVLTEALE